MDMDYFKRYTCKACSVYTNVPVRLEWASYGGQHVKDDGPPADWKYVAIGDKSFWLCPKHNKGELIVDLGTIKLVLEKIG